ncbi:NAD(P)-binding protein [Suhomyces tanzawaensis NRRL Y-17324]|uniref:NAD(P)-binding protein n=1 Tax=Suhomyces tanzawaensis NRRL Y-17324 TaxID=984487 RepID=A0A1E4SMF9_9ASCO|nr:NAD(P)-binding protein [Suhomyces tanzawaensis NRRL Y-17324]ODV80675.1 NAD(P)-binding protein [Suhomyces tanzawaensis NRRL Y-17324]
MSTTVFISGATGYIAQHTIKQFLDHGYSVIGSVRSHAKGEKLLKSFDNSRLSYVVVADIQQEGAFDQALKDHPEITGFLHTASPFHFSTDDPEKDLLIPAVKGTTNVLRAIADHGANIKKVLVTSSYAAMMTFGDEMNPSYVRDELSWNDLKWDDAKQNAIAGYVGSKAFAEKAAWEFLEMEKPGFQLATLNPAYVFGPQLFDEEVKGTLNTSAEMINQILKLTSADVVPKESGAFLDVRDVAKAHRVAFEKDEANQHRLLLQNGRFTSHVIRDIIAKRFPQLEGRLPQGAAESLAKILSRYCKLDDSKTRKVLDFDYFTLEQSIYDTVKQIAVANNW